VCDISTSGIFAVAETRPIFRGNWIKSFDPVKQTRHVKNRDATPMLTRIFLL